MSVQQFHEIFSYGSIIFNLFDFWLFNLFPQLPQRLHMCWYLTNSTRKQENTVKIINYQSNTLF